MENYTHLRLVQLPSSGGTCIISLLDRSRVDRLLRVFIWTGSMPPTWLLLIKMVSRYEMRYSTSGNDLNLKRNVNNYSDHKRTAKQWYYLYFVKLIWYIVFAHVTWRGEGANGRTYLLKDKITLRSLVKPSSSIGSEVNRLFLKKKKGH